MIVTKICPDCHRRWAAFSTSIDRAGLAQLTICCPSCHVRRQAKLREVEARYPSAESLGLLGSITEIPTERYSRPHARGRRIVRKSEPMGG